MRISLAGEDNTVRICFQGVTLPWKDALLYLGVLFDKRLNWGAQTQAIKAKLESRMVGLRRLKGKEFRLPSPLAVLT